MSRSLCRYNTAFVNFCLLPRYAVVNPVPSRGCYVITIYTDPALALYEFAEAINGYTDRL